MVPPLSFWCCFCCVHGSYCRQQLLLGYGMRAALSAPAAAQGGTEGWLLCSRKPRDNPLLQQLRVALATGSCAHTGQGTIPSCSNSGWHWLLSPVLTQAKGASCSSVGKDSTTSHPSRYSEAWWARQQLRSTVMFRACLSGGLRGQRPWHR